MVQFADPIGKPLHLLYYPPYHSKYHPMERCWGIVELHWKWDEVGRCQDHARGGEEYDMARSPSERGAEPPSVSQGYCTEQKSQTGDREPLGTPSRVAQVGYADPSSFCTRMRDILFEKSP
jgi:hypothetical protein